MLILIVAFSAASGGVYFMEESACQPVQLFFNTQMYETLCLHLISPLMQRAVTFPHKPGGGTDSLVFLMQSFSQSCLCLPLCLWRVKVETQPERAKCKPWGESVCQVELRADVWCAGGSRAVCLHVPPCCTMCEIIFSWPESMQSVWCSQTTKLRRTPWHDNTVSYTSLCVFVLSTSSQGDKMCVFFSVLTFSLIPNPVWSEEAENH